MDKFSKQQYERSKRNRMQARITFLHRYEEVRHKFNQQFQYKIGEFSADKDPELPRLLEENTKLKQKYEKLHDQHLFMQNAASKLNPLFEIRKALVHQINYVQSQLRLTSAKNQLIQNENQRIQKQFDKNQEEYEREILQREQQQKEQLMSISQQINLMEYKIGLLKQKYVEEKEERFIGEIKRRPELVEKVNKKQFELSSMRQILIKMQAIATNLKSQLEQQYEIERHLKKRQMEFGYQQRSTHSDVQLF